VIRARGIYQIENLAKIMPAGDFQEKLLAKMMIAPNYINKPQKEPKIYAKATWIKF
jgi:hypothetical protein